MSTRGRPSTGGARITMYLPTALIEAIRAEAAARDEARPAGAPRTTHGAVAAEWMADGRREMLTTQEAADLLNISRPTLLKRLEEGAIPYSWAGSHRRLLRADVIAYREAQQVRVEAAQDAMRALEAEAGLPD